KAELEADDEDGSTDAKLKLEAQGLPAGTYSVSVTLKSDGSTVPLGNFIVGQNCGGDENGDGNGGGDDQGNDDDQGNGPTPTPIATATPTPTPTPTPSASPGDASDDQG